MATVVVQAHPVEDSFNAALLRTVLAALGDQREPVATVRLGQGDDLDVATLEAATRLIVIYPTWFGTVPAQLLAALSETLGPWIDDGESMATSPLRSVRSLKAITSHGSSKLVNKVQSEPGLKLWKRVVLPLCEPNATFGWHAFYEMDRGTESVRSAFIAEAGTFATS